MKSTLQFDAYQYFLADTFADTQNEWEPYTENLALRFLLKYNENLDYMIERMNGFTSSNFKYLTSNEKNQLKIISNFICLRSLLKFHNVTKKVEIDYAKIDAIFLEIKDQEEIAELNEAINALKDADSTKKTGSFDKLNLWFDFLVSFIKYRDFRRSFYLDYLIQDEWDIPHREITTLFLNRKVI